MPPNRYPFLLKKRRRKRSKTQHIQLQQFVRDCFFRRLLCWLTTHIRAFQLRALRELISLKHLSKRSPCFYADAAHVSIHRETFVSVFRGAHNTCNPIQISSAQFSTAMHTREVWIRTRLLSLFDWVQKCAACDSIQMQKTESLLEDRACEQRINCVCVLVFLSIYIFRCLFASRYGTEID